MGSDWKRLSRLMVGVAILTTAIGSSFQRVDAQQKITACLTKKGKLKNVELGEKPKKDCRQNQTLVTFPISAKTDELMEDVSSLEAKGQQLMDDVADLQAKDQELMNNDVHSLMMSAPSRAKTSR